MRKYFGLLLCLVVSLFVFSVNVEAKTEMTTLTEAVKEEINYFGDSRNFETESQFQAYAEYVDELKNFDSSKYSESDDKINIYIFRGSSCWHCLDEITWLAKNYSEYSKYINVHTYEVWGNDSNNKLMKVVSKHLGKTASGVPFTVVGKETFSGFSETIGEQIITKAIDLYNTNLNSSDETKAYDIKNDIDLENGTVIGDSVKKSSTVVIVLLVITVIAGGAVLIYLISKSK